MSKKLGKTFQLHTDHANKKISSLFDRCCMNMLPTEKTKELLEIIPDLPQMSPQNIIYCSSIFPTEQVTQACLTVLKTSNAKQHLQMLSFHILLQQKVHCADLLKRSVFDSFEITALKIIAMSQHTECEESGQLMSALLDFHKHFFYKIGGQYPSLFFRVVWNVYHNSKRDQTLREIEQTVRVMLFDQPKYALYAVNFLNSIPFDLYSPTLLEVSACDHNYSY